QSPADRKLSDSHSITSLARVSRGRTPCLLRGLYGFALWRDNGVEDVARAHTIFIEKIAELHPEALGKPFVFGNCQAGWHAMIAACMRPDVVGPTAAGPKGGAALSALFHTAAVKSLGRAFIRRDVHCGGRPSWLRVAESSSQASPHAVSRSLM